MAMPLEGIKVIDITVLRQGPLAASMLADMGAEVIKIEDTKSGDPGRHLLQGGPFPYSPRNYYFDLFNRGKKGIALDLTKPEGQEILSRLVAKSDVFLSNYRESVLKRLGVDYDTLTSYNPRLIYASATGWGEKGPDSHLPVIDTAVQGRAGVMSVLGYPDQPPVTAGTGTVDQFSGTLLAYGIMVALFHRQRTGVGQRVQTSLLGGASWLWAIYLQSYLSTGQVPEKTDRRHVPNPLSNTYPTGDEKWLVLANNRLQADQVWNDLCQVLGMPQIASDPRFNSYDRRRENAAALVDILGGVFLTRSRDEWVSLLKQREIVCGPVNEYAEVVRDPQMLANEYIVEVDDPRIEQARTVGIPVHLSQTPGKVRRMGPEQGEHTEEVLREIASYTPQEIARLNGLGVIKCLHSPGVPGER